MLLVFVLLLVLVNACVCVVHNQYNCSLSDGSPFWSALEPPECHFHCFSCLDLVQHVLFIRSMEGAWRENMVKIIVTKHENHT